MKKPKIKDLRKGIIRCFSCGKKINFSEFEPLEIIECPYCNAQHICPYKVKSYWLYHPLGAGGMGSVYRAVNEDSGKEFAVKILPRNKKDDPELIESLMREGKIGSTFGYHPHLIAVAEYGESDGEYFMATEFIYGTRLDILLKSQGEYVDATGVIQGHLSERQALDIALQIIEAEQHIIECGYLFRDLKPENIIVEENGNVRLFDYGLCMSINEAADEENKSDTFEGSPFYIPPERIVGAPEGEYSEIYSLGMIIYYMITGRTYYSEAELQELIVKHVKSVRIKSVEIRLKHCSPDIAKIIDGMIKRMPDERIPDFELLKSYIQPVYEKIKNDTSQDIPLSSSNASESTSSEDGVKGLPLWAKLAITLASLIFITAAVLIPYYYSKYREYQARKKELIVRFSTELGVPENIPPPDIPEGKIQELINKRKDEIIKEKVAALPKFNEDKVKKEVYKKLNVSPDSIKTPEMSLQYYKKHFKEHINELIIQAVKKKAKDVALFLPFEKNINKIKKSYNYSVQDIKLAEKMISSDIKQKITTLIRKKLRIELPYSRPDKSVDEVKQLYKHFLMKIIKKKFSAGELSKRIMDITKKYSSYKKGETVCVTDDSGAKVKGMYKGRAGNKILVGEREILINIIPLNRRWQFDENLSAQKIAREIKKLKKAWKYRKKEFLKKLQKKYSMEKFYLQHRYYYSPLSNRYVSAKEVVNDYLDITLNRYKHYLADLIAKYRKEVTRNVTLDKFLFSKNFRKVGGKWYPAPKAVERLLKQNTDTYEKNRKKLIEKIKKQAVRQAEKEIYPKHHYVYYKGKWQPAKPLLEKLVNSSLKGLEHMNL